MNRNAKLLITGIFTLIAALSTTTRGTIAQEPPAFKPLPDPVEGSFDPVVAAKFDLSTIPLLPDFTAESAAELGDRIRAIWAEGEKRGLNAAAFSKVGDCMTATSDYLTSIGNPDTKLGEYTSLQAVIDHYKGQPVWESDPKVDSFTVPYVASASGFNAASVLDAIWSDPAMCGVEESPLVCELRLTKPQIAFMMFGTNDLNSLKASDFDYYLRQSVVTVHNNGTIPVLVTFPNQPGREEQSIEFNQIVASVAADYNVPLVNLWRALEPLPTQGIDPKNPTHMTTPADGNAADFTADGLQYGHNLHNLLSLQALELILKQVEVLD